MQPASILDSRRGTRTSIHFNEHGPESLVRDGSVDAYILPFDGGAAHGNPGIPYVAESIGMETGELCYFGRRSCAQSHRVTLVGFPTRRQDGGLRGVVLCPTSLSKSYREFARPFDERPYRDFHYRITFAAIAFATQALGARRLAMYRDPLFDEDIATCNAEALAHYVDLAESPIESFTFLGVGPDPRFVDGIRRLNAESSSGRHRPTRTFVNHQPQYVEIHVDVAGRSIPRRDAREVAA